MTAIRRTPSTEVLYGMHPVTEALAARRRRILEIFVASGKTAGREAMLREHALKEGIPLKEIPRFQLNQLAQTRSTQGIAARTTPYPVCDVGDLLKERRSGEPPFFFLVVDGVLDPQNLGALIRTGVCLGITGIVVPKDRCAPPTPAVSRASAGALEHVRMARVTNLVRFLKAFKERDVWIYGLDPGAKRPVFSVDLNGPVALVVGGEEKGIRSLVKRACDVLVSIPQKDTLNSMNVSVAGGIAMYAVFHQRMHGAS